MLRWPDKQRFSGLARSLVLLAGLVSGCGYNPNYAPVVERSGFPQAMRDTHQVRPGETLYAIAWRYGLDFRQLANANNLRQPYTIYPGQTLYLRGRAPVAVAAAKKPRTGQPAKVGKPATAGRTAGRAAKPAGKTAPSRSSTGSIAAPKPARLVAWRWPSSGPVGQAFSSKAPVHKGIDLRGDLGQPVVAANSGQVVYAGSGLVGYGNLIIIKHDDQYLSAYGHNSKILVKEGENVKAGDRIAEIGDTGTNSVKLHFEVRRNGQPIDPLQVLPRR